MKTVFVVNPKAGQGRNINKIISSIEETANALGKQIEIYITTSVGDASRFVKEYCETYGPARFIACGGDGTLNEVLNGVADYQDAEIGVIPMGTGNDFCRNFTKDFTSIVSQINGETVKCDAIKFTSMGKEGYCINMFNIGFDCNVADMTANMKKKPFISGPFAYFISILTALIKKKGAKLKIEFDGEEKHSGALLLTSIANGSFCGGGIKSNPLASVRDGFINVNIIKNISRLKFIRLLPYYMRGTHMKLKGIEDTISSVKCKKIKVTPMEGNFKICTDGEITDAGVTEFEVVPDAINFVVPV